MAEPDPIDGDDPYEILGATKMDSVGTIEAQKESLINDYQQAVREAKRDKDNEKFKRSHDALDAIEEAWEWMEANHTPPLVDGSVSLAVRTSNVVVGSPVTVRVTGDDGPVADAKVDVDRDHVQSEQTDGAGEATFTFDERGEVRITVPTTDAYADATETVTVDRRTVDLAFRNPPTGAEVDDDVEFVVVGDGSPEPGVTVAAENTTLGTTGSDGTVVHAFGDTGRKTVTATKSDDDAATYAECTHRFEVTEETVQLNVSVDGGDFEIGDDAVVEVTEPDGTTVEGAEVTVGDRSDTTNPNGRVKLPLDVGGRVTVTAAKSAPDEPRDYLDDDAQIRVAKRRASIRIADVEGSLMENDDLLVRVVDGAGDPLPGATVTSNWGHDETTDDGGEATLALDDYGDLQITASKETEEVDHGEDRWRETVEEYTRTLVVERCPETAGPGDTIDIRVTDSAGEPVRDAEVRCDKQPGKTWTTDRDGRATVSLRNQVGVRKIWVLKDDGEFNDARVDRNVHVLG